jgi:hypothetical protein
MLEEGRGGKLMNAQGRSMLLWGLALGFLLGTAQATEVAIRRAGGQGWGAQTAYGQLFDPATVENLRGEVVSVERFTPLRQMGYGFLVVLETSTETIDVHVGPGWFVAEQDFEIAPGDRIMVRGSRILFDEKPAIIATEVRKGDRLLKLRLDNGQPVWSEEEGG